MWKNKEEQSRYNKSRYEKNKECITKKAKEWTENNRERSREIKRKNKNKNKKESGELIESIKKSTPCKCGESDSCCLEFHHIDRDNKKNDVAKLHHEGYTLQTVKDEIAKCVIMCSNCHRKVNKGSITYGNSKGRYVKDLKNSSECSRCEESNNVCLDFHHERDKIMNIELMVRNTAYSIEDLKNELSKCIILCSNCHRKHHKIADDGKTL